MKKTLIYLLFSIGILLSSCSTTKFVPEGQLLLDKVNIETDNKEIKPSSLYPYLKQRPNASAFGILKISLKLYSLSGFDSTKWGNKWIRRTGAPPVIYDSLLCQASANELKKLLFNKGYMNATVSREVVKRKKRADVTYRIHTGNPYTLRNFHYDVRNKGLSNLLQKDSTGKAIQPGMLFDRAILDKERERITTLARNNGYYAFTNEMITYTADSTRRNHQVDLTLNIKPISSVDSITAQRQQQRYLIDNVYIYLMPNLAIDDTVGLATDTVFYNGIYAISKGNKWIDPKTLINSCFITPGRIFSDRMVEHTYTSFNRLPVIKYLNINFEPKERSDSLFVDCHIQVTEGKTTSITGEVMGTNTAGDLGFALSAGYQFRNTFNRGVTFGVKARGAYENMSSVDSEFKYSNYYELGGEASLTFPKFVFPFLSRPFKRRFKATSEAIANYNYQQRPEYIRTFTGVAWTYKWSSNNLLRHSFDLINLSFVSVPYMSQEFKYYLQLQSPMMARSFDSHFILGTGYRFVKTNQEQGKFKQNVYSLRGSIESSGNLLYAISKLSGQKTDSLGTHQFFGLPYSQYIRADLNYAQSINFSPSNSLNFHAALGVAYPYGNMKSIPYEKRFYAGGANSVRGWSVRSLGPGNYEVPPGNEAYAYAYQLGDMRLDLSIEHRTRLFWKFESALFIDAGNIWNIYPDPQIESSVFSFKEFYKQIALAYGIGLRLNFDYFIVRVDWGFKLYNPAGKGSWVTPFSGNDNTLNFAIGYPF